MDQVACRMEELEHSIRDIFGLTRRVQPAIEFSATLVDAFFEANAIATLVRVAVDSEVDHTEDAERLFRGESCATRVLDLAFQRTQHNSYIRAVLRVLVKKLAHADDAELQVELEAGRGLSADDCTLRFKFILAAIDRFLKRLANNSFLVPYHVRVAFSQLRASIAAKFPHVDAITSCTSLFFLRIFSPAILNPSLYGVFSSPLRPATLRALLLVSRILQSSANGQPPSSPFSNIINLNVIANVAIERYTPQLRSFMESVIDPNAIAELEKVQPQPLHNQIKRLKRTTIRAAREQLESTPSDAFKHSGSSVTAKSTKSRSGSHPVMPLAQSSPSKTSKKKSKSKTTVRPDIVGNRARALTSHDVFFQPDDATSSTSTPPASPRPTISFAIPTHTASAPAVSLTQQQPENASPSKRNLRLKLGTEELEESLSQRTGADGVSWLVSPRRSAVNSTAEAKRKRLVNRLSTMLPKKSVLDEFDSLKHPS